MRTSGQSIHNGADLEQAMKGVCRAVYHPVEGLCSHGALSGFLHSGCRATQKQSDVWTAEDIALFEASLCIYGKDFSKAKDIILTKTLAQIVQFYYLFKMTDHYKVWKRRNIPTPNAKFVGPVEQHDRKKTGPKRSLEASGAFDHPAQKKACPSFLNLKGVLIPKLELLREVENLGGYDTVVQNRSWQVIRKKLNLPQTTSSGYQLRRAYIHYTKSV